MKSSLIRSLGVAFLVVAAISLSGCGLWDRSASKKDDDRLGWLITGKGKLPANRSLAQAEQPEPQAQGKDGGQQPTEGQKELQEGIGRLPGSASTEQFSRQEPPGAFDLNLRRLFGLSKEDGQKQKSLEERIAQLEAQLAATTAPVPEGPASAAARARVVAPEGRGPVNRVAMVAFEPEAPNPKGFGQIPLEIVASALEKEPRLIVVKQPLVDRVLQERRIRPTAEHTKQVATVLERDLGTQLVIFVHEASVNTDWDRRGQVHAEVVLKGEIHEGVTGEKLSLLSAKGTQAGSGSQEALARVEALKQATNQLSAAILKEALEYEWTARVLSVEDGRIRLNAGRRSGLREGDLLRVFASTGQQVYHPTTKLLVGLDLGDPKGEVQVTDFFGADAAIAKITGGSGFAPNDLLKLEKR